MSQTRAAHLVCYFVGEKMFKIEKTQNVCNLPTLAAGRLVFRPFPSFVRL